MNDRSQGAVADVALVLEGTWPYVRGGVSSWVDQLIRGLPDLRFSVLFIGGDRESCGEPRHELPPNVVHLQRHFLSPQPDHRGNPQCRGDARLFQMVAAMHQEFSRASADSAAAALAAVGAEPERVEGEFRGSELAWEQICGSYRERCPRLPFTDYFWAVRSLHAPLFGLAAAAMQMPPARCYHSASTGFAGLAAAMAASRARRPLVLTEHGIYTKERTIELLQAEWLRSLNSDGLAEDYLRGLWIRFFESIGRMTYSVANPIIALYEGNRRRQIRDGAPEERTTVIPNGIDVPRLSALRASRGDGVPPVLGLLGRVVPIKDIKTFLRTMRIVCAKIPAAEGWVIGPTEEDPQYAMECRELACSLELGDRVKFLGFQKVADVLPKLGLMVLSSISEAQPLVLLEGFAAGVPGVATDVGCCRELLEGADEEDRKLGRAGAVVPLADPERLADAAVGFLQDAARWKAAQRAGIARVEGRYSQAAMLASYRRIYEGCLRRSVRDCLKEA